jgi:CRP-like cAMP-binding protein
MFDVKLITNYLKLFKSITPQHILQLYKISEKKEIAEMAYWIKPGEQSSKIAYIEKGLIRVFSIDDSGNEITILVRCENQFITSYDKILFDKVTRFYYQAIEPTTLIMADYDKIQTTLKDNPQLEKARSYFLRKMLGESILRVETFILLSPEKRYEKFISENSNLYQRIPDKYIASMLGITPVSLSRIKKRLTKRKAR